MMADEDSGFMAESIEVSSNVSEFWREFEEIIMRLRLGTFVNEIGG